MTQFAHHGALVANTVTTVLLNRPGGVEVVNRSGTSEIFFTVGPQNNPPAAPTVGGDDCYIVPASICSTQVPLPYPGGSAQQAVEVQLISVGAPNFSVIGTGGPLE